VCQLGLRYAWAPRPRRNPNWVASKNLGVQRRFRRADPWWHAWLAEVSFPSLEAAVGQRARRSWRRRVTSVARRRRLIVVDIYGPAFIQSRMNTDRPDRGRATPRRSTGSLAQVALRAFRRLFGRDVMLYTGGVSFFALARCVSRPGHAARRLFPIVHPAQAGMQAETFAPLLPAGVRVLFQSELVALAHAPTRIVSTQSGMALLIGLYAAHRAFKALIAGLSFIHDESKPRVSSASICSLSQPAGRVCAHGLLSSCS